jgi:hypothetical protein
MTELTRPLGPGGTANPKAAVTSARATPRQVLVIVCAGVVLASLDLFIVNVALP